MILASPLAATMNLVFVNIRTLTSALSTFLPTPRSIALAGSSPSNAHGRFARSVPPPHTRHIHKSPGSLISSPLLAHPAKSGTHTWVPIQRDTGNAISYAIMFEICSLPPPFFDVAAQLDLRITVSGLFGNFPSGTGLASPPPAHP